MGITSLLPHWQILLQQIGLPFNVININEQLAADEVPILIISEKKINAELIHQYLNSGGCILTEVDIAENLLNIKTKKIFIKFLQDDVDEIFSNNMICDVYKNCSVAKNSNHLKNQNKIKTVLSMNVGTGKAIIFPSGFSSLILNDSVIRKNFISHYGNIETNERVAKVSKGSVYHLIKNALEYLYHFRNLPFITLWQFPNGEKNIFSFRVDTDFGTQFQLKNLYDTFEKNKISATWFVETKSIEGSNNSQLLDLYNSFNGQEFALHCYRHKVFSGYKKNYENIKRGLEILNQINSDVKGSAAPFGEWNYEFCKALENLNFNYSSEFSYAYDCLPMFPFTKNNFSKVLQIPIHPLSFGRLKWGGNSDSEMLNYFYKVIDEKIILNEPIILYTHPAEERLNILDKIFKKINSLNIPDFTFSEIYEWWNKRLSLKWHAEFIDQNIKISSNINGEKFWLRVFYPDKKTYLSPLSSKTYKDKIIDNTALQINYNHSPKELRRTSARMIWHDLLFKYRKSKQ